MIERSGKYPVYAASNPKITDQRVTTTFTYEQLIEIANIFYFVNKVLAGKLFGGIRLTENVRSIHKAIHDSAINCALSLEERERNERGRSELS